MNRISQEILAKERTDLANERTMLSYWRTSLALLGLGIVILKFMPEYQYYAAGAITLSAILFIFSIYRFLTMKKTIEIKY